MGRIHLLAGGPGQRRGRRLPDLLPEPNGGRQPGRRYSTGQRPGPALVFRGYEQRDTDHQRGLGLQREYADRGVQAARVQAPRSLWDPTYVENSWITADSTNGQAIQLLPRKQAKINATAATYGSKYTANQISISEYNYGGGDDISGGIAEADVLGIFGQQGVLSANEWQLNSNESFIGGASRCTGTTTARAAPSATSPFLPPPATWPTPPAPRSMPATTRRTPPA